MHRTTHSIKTNSPLPTSVMSFTPYAAPVSVDALPNPELMVIIRGDVEDVYNPITRETITRKHDPESPIDEATRMHREWIKYMQDEFVRQEKEIAKLRAELAKSKEVEADVKTKNRYFVGVVAYLEKDKAKLIEENSELKAMVDASKFFEDEANAKAEQMAGALKSVEAERDGLKDELANISVESDAGLRERFENDSIRRQLAEEAAAIQRERDEIESLWTDIQQREMAISRGKPMGQTSLTMAATCNGSCEEAVALKTKCDLLEETVGMLESKCDELEATAVHVVQDPVEAVVTVDTSVQTMPVTTAHTVDAGVQAVTLVDAVDAGVQAETQVDAPVGRVMYARSAWSTEVSGEAREMCDASSQPDGLASLASNNVLTIADLLTSSVKKVTEARVRSVSKFFASNEITNINELGKLSPQWMDMCINTRKLADRTKASKRKMITLVLETLVKKIGYMQTSMLVMGLDDVLSMAAQ